VREYAPRVLQRVSGRRARVRLRRRAGAPGGTCALLGERRAAVISGIRPRRDRLRRRDGAATPDSAPAPRRSLGVPPLAARCRSYDVMALTATDLSHR